MKLKLGSQAYKKRHCGRGKKNDISQEERKNKENKKNN